MREELQQEREKNQEPGRQLQVVCPGGWSRQVNGQEIINPGSAEGVRTKGNLLRKPLGILRRRRRKPQRPSRIVDIGIKLPPIKEPIVPTKILVWTRRWRL